MSQTVGGGVSLEGRAAGGLPINDLGDDVVGSAVTGKKFTTYTINRDPDRRGLEAVDEPVKSTSEDDAAAPTRQYIVKEELKDRLVCRRFKDGEEFTAEGDPEDILIAKPHNARRTVWENETINGISYIYPDENDHSLRIASREGEDPLVNPPVFQRYVNPYIIDFSIIYADESVDGTELAITLIDKNNDGRQWAVERPLTEAEQA